MSDNDIASVLQRFGKKHGLEDLQFDSLSQSLIAFDDIVVVLEYVESRGDMLLTAAIRPVPQPLTPDLAKMFLELNYLGMQLGAGQIGLDSPAGQLMFADRLSLAGLTDRAFEAFVEASINRIESWQRLLDGMAPGQDTAAAAEELRAEMLIRA